jgi:hypothetical protein
LDTVSDDDLSKMEVAALNSLEVNECLIPLGTTGREWVRDYVAARRRQADFSVMTVPETVF